MALTLLGGGGTALPAQEPPDSVVPLDSVVVTVTRGPHGLGRTPFAVSVQGQRNLQLGNTGFSLEEALHGLPGAQVQNRYNYTVGERISIRGFGARAQFGVRGLKVLVDGIPATLADGQSTLDHLDIRSLGRAEIMRGPASAMYGNGGGGVLSFETAQPPDQRGTGQPGPRQRPRRYRAKGRCSAGGAGGSASEPEEGVPDSARGVD